MTGTPANAVTRNREERRAEVKKKNTSKNKLKPEPDYSGATIGQQRAVRAMAQNENVAGPRPWTLKDPQPPLAVGEYLHRIGAMGHADSFHIPCIC